MAGATALWTKESWILTLHSQRVEEGIFPSPDLKEQFLSAKARVRRGSCIGMGHTQCGGRAVSLRRDEYRKQSPGTEAGKS